MAKKEKANEAEEQPVTATSPVVDRPPAMDFYSQRFNIGPAIELAIANCVHEVVGATARTAAHRAVMEVINKIDCKLIVATVLKKEIKETVAKMDFGGMNAHDFIKRATAEAVADFFGSGLLTDD